MCADKKAASINWDLGRGKSVISKAIISSQVIERVLKTSVKSLVELANIKFKNGSLKAGAIGGENAHSANVVAAIFLATGQVRFFSNSRIRIKIKD